MKNYVVLEGIMANEIREKYSEKNTPIASFSIATQLSEKYTSYVPCVAYGDLALKIFNYKKGDAISIEAQLKSGKYVNKEGKNVYTLDVVCTSIGGEIEVEPTIEGIKKGYAYIEEEIPF